jgi:hypothetical protein
MGRLGKIIATSFLAGSLLVLGCENRELDTPYQFKSQARMNIDTLSDFAIAKGYIGGGVRCEDNLDESCGCRYVLRIEDESITIDTFEPYFTHIYSSEGVAYGNRGKNGEVDWFDSDIPGELDPKDCRNKLTEFVNKLKGETIESFPSQNKFDRKCREEQ